MDALADLVDEWMLTLTEVSEETRTVYRRGADQFTAWLAEAHPKLTEPHQITTRHIHEWMRHLADAGRSKATRRVRLIAVRLLLGYLAAEGVIEVNPAAGIALPEAEEHVVPVIHDEDLTRLLRATDGPGFLERRDTAAMRLLLDTGCRRGELAGINLDDVDLRAQQVTLYRTKGSRPRIVPFGAKTALALRKYLRARAKHPAAASAPLLLTQRPGVVGGWRLSGGGVAEMLARRCAAVGMAPINPHKFRHTWAHDLLANGANEGDVEKLAGWRSPVMVRRYGASAADERARDAARRMARGDRV
ncbi:tyrosine-type recombinase/integrase [Actinomycetospora lutea]|uniref:tyrosine-type recombinase/integrase n=1 Tax=Actinomycetospora lutea TaxID=663604 RepID=UPI0023660961|nr:tyrosine-type recombinase/integrase [Actinomycetospora lutea]MDD7940456.1 tyrosine-type recombinase/integrase [Actinomycetospora lutea]